MRRPVLWCLLSFLLGAYAAWRYLAATRPAEPATAPAAPIAPWPDDAPTGEIPVVPEEREVTRVFGTLDDALSADAAPAGPDGAAPSDEYTVKGSQGRFHTTESPDYPTVRATVWFKTTADAERAGFTPWHG
ncbi:sunset domain-containing protein [Actinokineospora iranica]|uniref:Secreted protein n=1 Tax=Actinokineospora iranica TaxID=1271860 RepID=A0A1G6UVS2_9PSEU|nr:hypothetical protein [Actinokineospora iranica]SDD45371.1 hypothetical protein SAMN05216174_111111 [Actinokineospora iranica]